MVWREMSSPRHAHDAQQLVDLLLLAELGDIFAQQLGILRVDAENETASERQFAVEKHFAGARIDELSASLLHIEAEEGERLSVRIEEQVRMRIRLPLASHLELLELELGLIVAVDAQCRAVADVQTAECKVVAHLNHELDDERLEAGQYVAGERRVAEDGALAVEQLSVEEAGEVDDLGPAGIFVLHVLDEQLEALARLEQSLGEREVLERVGELQALQVLTRSLDDLGRVRLGVEHDGADVSGRLHLVARQQLQRLDGRDAVERRQHAHHAVQWLQRCCVVGACAVWIAFVRLHLGRHELDEEEVARRSTKRLASADAVQHAETQQIEQEVVDLVPDLVGDVDVINGGGQLIAMVVVRACELVLVAFELLDDVVEGQRLPLDRDAAVGRVAIDVLTRSFHQPCDVRRLADAGAVRRDDACIELVVLDVDESRLRSVF